MAWHVFKRELVAERPQLKVVLGIALGQFGHLFATVRLHHVRHLHDAHGHVATATRSARHLELTPRVSFIQQFPRPERIQILRWTFGQSQYRNELVETDALVLVSHQAVAHQREVVLRDQFMLEAVVRHADVIVGENLEAGARLEVHQLAVVHGVHGRDCDLGDDVIHVPFEVLALQSLPKLLAFLQRLVLLWRQLDALELVRAERRVEVLARAVHPRLGDSHQVLRDDRLAIAVEFVGEVLEDVSDARAHHLQM